MSSKNENSDPAPWEEPRRKWRSWAIASRLAVLIALTTFGVLTFSTLIMFRVLSSSVEREQIGLLRSKVDLLRHMLVERPLKELVDEVQWEPPSTRLPDYFARVLGNGRSLVIEAPGMGEILPPSAFPPPVRVSEEPTSGLRWEALSGKVYRLISARAAPATRGAPWVIQVAQDITDQETVLHTFGLGSFGILLLGALLSATIGAYLSRQALRPISSITALAERISATQLRERIGGEGWPREVASLAVVFDGMLDRLETSFRRLSQFSADLAHELRTPLSNLSGEIEVALSRKRDPDEYQRVLESSFEECGRLIRLVEDMLFMARADADRAPIKPQPLDGREEAEAVRDYFSAASEESGIEVSCTGSATVVADQGMLRRALSNLLSNALHYTERGGKVVIDLSSTKRDTVIRVTDTGRGILPRHLPRIFDRFYRVDGSRTHGLGGTGLGLSIVKSIMDLHGGSVDIKSTPGVGTTLTLKFPGKNPSRQ